MRMSDHVALIISTEISETFNYYRNIVKKADDHLKTISKGNGRSRTGLPNREKS